MRGFLSLVILHFLTMLWIMATCAKWIWRLLVPAKPSDSNAWVVAFQKLIVACGCNDAAEEVELRSAALGLRPWIPRLIAFILRLLMLDKVHGAAYGRAVVRDELLTRQIDEGATQVVIIGGGFEILAFDVLHFSIQRKMRRLSIIEVDFPNIQRQKLDNVIRIMGASYVESRCAGIRFVECSYGTGELRRVLDPYVCCDVETVVVLEGVTMYLSPAEFRDVIRTTRSLVRNIARPPVHFIFDALDEKFVNEGPRNLDLVDLARFLISGGNMRHAGMIHSGLEGAPFKTGFDINNIPSIETKYRLKVLQVVTYPELVSRVFVKGGRLDQRGFKLHFEHLDVVAPSLLYSYCVILGCTA